VEKIINAFKHLDFSYKDMNERYKNKNTTDTITLYNTYVQTRVLAKKKQLIEDEGLESVCQSSAASCRVGQGVEKVMKGGGVKESRDRQESGHVRVCRLAARSL